MEFNGNKFVAIMTTFGDQNPTLWVTLESYDQEVSNNTFGF